MEIANSKFYKKLTSYQRSIIDNMKQGGILKCTEGANYKVWLKMPDGSIKSVRRDSAEVITSEDSYQFLAFDNDGVKIKNN